MKIQRYRIEIKDDKISLVQDEYGSVVRTMDIEKWEFIQYETLKCEIIQSIESLFKGRDKRSAK